MKVVCTHCGASGQMDETRIPPGVSSIKCPKCNQSFPIPAIDATDSPQPGVAVPEAVQAADSPTPQPPPLAQSAAPASPPRTASPAMATCTVCSGHFSPDEMVRFGTAWVCATCKPRYVQMLAQGTSRPGEMRYAGFGIRFGAKFLDGLILGALNFFIGILFGVLISKSSPGAAMGSLALLYILQIGIAACYSGYFLSRYRATPGKMACGLVVVTAEGQQISFGRGVGRHFSEFISSLILLIGYLMVLFDDEKRALHDRICNTRVVYK